jgi:hypothetical protein
MMLIRRGMSTDQRLDRLERIVMMFARAGARARREMNEKINMLIDAQIKNEDRFAKFDERFVKFDERCAKYDAMFAMHSERFAKTDERLKELGERTDKTLQILMDIVGNRPNPTH